MKRLAFLLLLSLSLPSRAELVSVAVASNFLAPARALAQAFEKASGHAARLSAGSTGKLYAQIVNGAPYDIFLAANEREPARLELAGAAVPGTRFTYARGRLVLWSADPRRVPAQGEVLLKSGHVGRLAIANPRTAPYGSAAVAALRALGVYERIGPSLIRAESIGQAFQFAASGNADLGLVALSQIEDPNNRIRGSAWLVPADLYPSIRQQAVLLARGRDNVGARAYLEFLKGAEATAVIKAYGYGIESTAAGHAAR